MKRMRDVIDKILDEEEESGLEPDANSQEDLPKDSFLKMINDHFSEASDSKKK